MSSRQSVFRGSSFNVTMGSGMVYLQHVSFLDNQKSYRGGSCPPSYPDTIPLSKCARNCTLPRLFANATRDSLRHYQDADGLEVDVVIELADGTWVGVEVKLGEDKVPEGMANLERLCKKVAVNPAARNPEPALMTVVTANLLFARFDRGHGVYVPPLTTLCP